MSPSGMVETPRLQAKNVCHSEAQPKNLNALTETLRFAQGDSLGGSFEFVGPFPTDLLLSRAEKMTEKTTTPIRVASEMAKPIGKGRGS